jgi:predicted metalloprotease with PDZ domain
MKKIIYRAFNFILLILLLGCGDTSVDTLIPTPTPQPIPTPVPTPTGPFVYELDLTKITSDSFKIKLNLDGLQQGNTIFQFATTIPGTYFVLDFGKYVGGFKAYDGDSKRIPVKRESTNQFSFSDPAAVRAVTYSVKKTFSLATSYGSNIFPHCVFFTTPGLFGFPLGGTGQEIKLKIITPADWILATTLRKTEDGYFTAPDYNSFADAPVFAGLLQQNLIKIGNTQFDIYSFSSDGVLQLPQLINDVTLAMTDASKFFNVIPLDHYSFYFYFSFLKGDALEHAQCSMHINSEGFYSSEDVRTRAVHEFFHIVAPLNLHSEIIENFNFESPMASQHLWLYEGVTVWAAYMMQYRNGSLSLNVLLKELSGRIRSSRNISLTETSLGVYAGQSSSDAYLRGVAVAALMDIKLLALSNGTSGLRELLLKLNEKYGPKKPFSEGGLFAEITQMTNPEMDLFINSYIKGASSLPTTELFSQIGIDFNEVTGQLSMIPAPNASQAFLFSVWSRNLK